MGEINQKARLLRQLNVESIKIDHIKSDSLLNVEKLTNININHWAVQRIDEDIFSNSKRTLKTINLSNNLLIEFPLVFQSEILTVLKLGFNQLKSVPDEIENLLSLKTLELNDNLLTEINVKILLKNFRTTQNPPINRISIDYLKSSSCQN